MPCSTHVETRLWVKQYLRLRTACCWTACFHWALALSFSLLCCGSGRGRSSASDSVRRLAIPGRVPEPPPCDTLSVRPHQHDFHCCPRAGGTPSGEKQTNMEAAGVQVYRPCSFDFLWVQLFSISWFRFLALVCGFNYCMSLLYK